MRSRFMEWRGLPFFFFPCVWGWGTYTCSKSCSFPSPPFFLYIQRFPSLFSQIMWDKETHMQSNKVEEGDHIATSYDVLRAILLRKANVVTWCKSLGLLNLLFWKCCYVKSRCEWIAHLSQPEWTSSRVTHHPSIHPSNICMDGWMDGCCVDRKQFVQWKGKKKKKVFPVP
jgi:hypothetical protein